MTDKAHLSKNTLIVLGIIWIFILICGLILINFGYNEAFYLNYTIIQIASEVFAFMGSATFFIIIIIIFFISYDKKFAKNLLMSLLFSVYINNFLKETFKDPRPPANVAPNEEYGLKETGFGFPSGHSQNGVAVWGFVANEFKDKPNHHIITLILSIFILIVAISRLTLGVHDVEDVVGGLLIGIVFLIAFIHLEPIFSEKLKNINLSLKIILVFVFSISLFLIGTLLFPSNGLGLIDNPPIYADAGEFAVVGGSLLGFLNGYLLESKYINYNPSELSNKQKIINLIMGIILVFGIFLILELTISGNVFLRFLRYAILSFIASLLLPFLLTKMNRT